MKSDLGVTIGRGSHEGLLSDDEARVLEGVLLVEPDAEDLERPDLAMS